MNAALFSGPAHVEIQGKRVLSFEPPARNPVEYRVIGFDTPSITLHDYRVAGLKAIADVERTRSVATFATRFNIPAHVTIVKQDDTHIAIELRETENADPPYRLWIAIGIRDEIPVYAYLFDVIAPLEDDSFAFAALYCRGPDSSLLSAAN
ncbi:MAG TPA: hypothetical protein PKZ84_13405 [Anaerolineae bacterium]|nr:hypothetical protein [Anaerolineae bacterium]HQI86489.1 hypothetical protein [Anaerolineae bacterium]